MHKGVIWQAFTALALDFFIYIESDTILAAYNAFCGENLYTSLRVWYKDSYWGRDLWLDITHDYDFDERWCLAASDRELLKRFNDFMLWHLRSSSGWLGDNKHDFSNLWLCFTFPNRASAVSAHLRWRIGSWSHCTTILRLFYKFLHKHARPLPCLCVFYWAALVLRTRARSVCGGM